MVNYPSVDIPGIEQEYNHHYLEPSNIDILRHEREEAIQKRLIELKSEKVNNKIKKFNEKILKDNEKNNRLKRKIEERNNKIYFLPYKKINIYNNYQRKGIKSTDLNRSTNIQFDDLIIEK